LHTKLISRTIIELLGYLKPTALLHACAKLSTYKATLKGKKKEATLKSSVTKDNKGPNPNSSITTYKEDYIVPNATNIDKLNTQVEAELQTIRANLQPILKLVYNTISNIYLIRIGYKLRLTNYSKTEKCIISY
jgi:hypothetical protein